MKKILLCFTVLLLAAAVHGAEPVRVEYTAAPEAGAVSPFELRPVAANQQYESNVTLFVEKFVPGAVISCEAVQLDAAGKEIGRTAISRHRQDVNSAGFKLVLPLSFKTKPEAVNVRMDICYGGNPVTFQVQSWELAPVGKKELFKGIYDKFDPDPADRSATLQKMSELPGSAAWVETRNGRPLLVVDGKVTPLNAYKGDADYKMFGESGGNIILTFNCGRRMFRGVAWDKELYDAKTGKFDFSAIENNLLRIYNANPNARVIIGIGIDPDDAFLDKYPENILLNEHGVRGKAGFSNFIGFSNEPLKGKERWAHSYTGETYQQYVENGIREMMRFLRNSPAGKIVIGFQIAGGHDGQFVQWEYGAFRGHFDYSEANRQALCKYLTEIYQTDAALQKAWDDPKVTLKTAANPTVEEFRSMIYFDDRPGLGRKIADCRRFIAIGTARMLNRFARVAKEEWQRPCLVEVWYSTAIWAQPSRLALDELIKGDAVNIIGMVSYYAPTRSLGSAGASANSCIQALNVRKLIYLQEMDHRTWRTQRVNGASMNAVAFPADAKDFYNQIIRDGGSVIASGGQGFYLYDMFGSWYHDPEAQKPIRMIYEMNKHATKYAGKFPAPKVAIFMDEATRLMSEYVPNYVNSIWRTSGVTPALHFLSDLDNPALPEYDLYIMWSPLTMTRAQLEKLKSLADRPGKVLYIIGDAGRTSRDLAGSVDVIGKLGMELKEETGILADTVVAAPGVVDPVLENVSGVLESTGLAVSRGQLQRRIQHGYTVIDDPQAKILGVTERGGKPVFAVKTMPGGGKLYFCGRNAALTPQLLHNLAKSAGIQPFSAPGNAVYVGNGVAVVHRTAGEVEVDFGFEATLIDPATGKVIGKMRKWKPLLAVGESAAVCYLPPEK